MFDKSKTGYVNLLQSQRIKSKNRGDDKQMVNARSQFLDTQGYSKFRTHLEQLIEGNSVLDIGCGEGWYASNLCERGLDVSGIDISKAAIEKASKRNKTMTLAVASSFDLPFLDASFDTVYCVFAPFDLNEVYRVLKPGGIFIDVFALEDHLLQMKEIVYPEVYKNDIKILEHPSMTFERIDRVEDTLEVRSQTMIQNLFSMTPYAHRTPRDGKERLDALENLKTQIGFGFGIYRKGE